jgi:chromosome segregation protein
MYLKTLTALGFKSFADKTSLTFRPGMTAIVGPNGCGKSNVSDAIRWVLGEQSAKALRGGEMADVIFNGTEGRKQMGLAEVSLTLGDMDVEPLRAAGVPVEYNEVTVTRRVYRDGGSDYFLNKTPCRLRDVQQLFAGTGLGKASYSVMAQGNITQLLSSRPEDRRLVFEEAAGITRFRMQKREALRKLEATDQNLLRVEDLIREVKRQIGSLQRQAGKARRHQSMSAELRRLELQLARRQHDALKGEIAEREARVAGHRSAAETSAEAVLRLEDEVARVRADLAELDRQISAAQKREMELQAEGERRRGRIQYNEERRVELETRARAADSEAASADERARAAEDELASVEERLNAALERQTETRGVLEERRARQAGFEAALAGFSDELRKAQGGAFELAQRLSRARNEQNQIALRRQADATRLEKLRAEQTGLEEEGQRLEVRLAEFSAEAEAGELQVRTSRESIQDLQARIGELEEEARTAQHALDALLRRQAEVRSRLGVLEQLDAQREGVDAGAVAALKAAGAAAAMLADRIRTPAAHVAAIEAALGRRLETVLASNSEEARRIVRLLVESGEGRAAVAAADLCRIASPPDEAPALEGAVRASSVVETDEECRPLVDALLGATYLAADLDAATKLFAELGGRYDVATASGECLWRGGVYFGGRQGKAKTPQGGGVLARKNQIAELRAELEKVSAEASEAARTRGAVQSEVTAVRAALDGARQELRSREVAAATRRGELNGLQQAQRSLKQKGETVRFELESLSAREAEGAARLEEAGARIAAAEAEQMQADERARELALRLEEARRERDESATLTNDAKVAAATEEQVVAGLGRQRPPLAARIQELRGTAARLRAEIDSFGSRKAAIEAETETLWAEAEALGREREEASTAAAALASERAGLDAGLAGREARLKDERARQAEAQTRRSELEIEIAQRTSTLESLTARILEKYQVNVGEIEGEGIKITFADEGQPKVEFVGVEELAAAGLTVDWEAASNRVRDLQRKLEDLGPVNLVAIDEFAEAEQRHEFLNKQFEELRDAKKQLVEVIEKINQETRAMFADTFEKIRNNFRAMFSEVFGGGKADLELVSGEDPLEAGIEIMARPPGKQLQSISLLSGGEQTMTAVALLFSIYQVKPSPFCLLDELDAPLDESNINRFIKVLRRFLDHSQFVVITHNKRTIGMADAVYGVTMEEQGVSKIVGMRFDDSNGAGRGAAPAQAQEQAPVAANPEPGPLESTEPDVVMAK